MKVPAQTFLDSGSAGRSLSSGRPKAGPGGPRPGM